ncbi:36050_t:CDS:1, partial [Gigaspora margarita]
MPLRYSKNSKHVTNQETIQYEIHASSKITTASKITESYSTI